MPRSSTTFEKGKSGNPAGRPKVVEDVRLLAREHTKTAINSLVAVAKKGPPAARVAASSALLDRAYGRPAQTHGADPENPLLPIELVVMALRAAQNGNGNGNGNGKHELESATGRSGALPSSS